MRVILGNTKVVNLLYPNLALQLTLIFIILRSKRGHGNNDTNDFCIDNQFNAIGAKPILADINPETFNIDPKNIERCITKNKAILIVHLAGLLVKLKK